MNDPNLSLNLLVILLVIYIVSLHELAHAYTATWFGDPTPGRFGRLTWNPLAHLQPIWTAVLFPIILYLSSGMIFCLAMTPVDPTRFRRPLRDNALVAAAGPAANLLATAVLVGLLWTPLAKPGTYFTGVVTLGAFWSLFGAVFNLLPLPGLDGYEVIRVILPLQLRRALDNVRRMGFVPMILIFVLGPYLAGPAFGFAFGFFQQVLPPVALEVLRRH